MVWPLLENGCAFEQRRSLPRPPARLLRASQAPMGHSNTEEGALYFAAAQTRWLQGVGRWLRPALQAAGGQQAGRGEDTPGRASTSRLLIPPPWLPSLTRQVPQLDQTV